MNVLIVTHEREFRGGGVYAEARDQIWSAQAEIQSDCNRRFYICKSNFLSRLFFCRLTERFKSL